MTIVDVDFKAFYFCIEYFCRYFCIDVTAFNAFLDVTTFIAFLDVTALRAFIAFIAFIALKDFVEVRVDVDDFVDDDDDFLDIPSGKVKIFWPFRNSSLGIGLRT